MLIKGNFSELHRLTDQIRSTVGRVDQEMSTWQTMSGQTAEGWQDQAGGQFTEVSAAWQQVSQAQQQMLEALRGGVDNTNTELQQALASAKARVGSTSI